MDATMENKMGLPPPYEPSAPNPAPPPSYFGDNPPPPAAPTTQPRTVVVTSAPTSSDTSDIKIGPRPTGITCPNCNRSVVTRVHYAANNRTHIISAGLCILTGCCCGCFVPYCMRSCKSANHFCPKCRAFIGTYAPS
ncbi:PREDICTED: lipopolysaccharide-induced tumor necrosis factor-alpha factor homolog [Papilio polytes]|uniref:lipopolysaccharide-induced tumor necrosis factor-alpha factor homolog n=1 Tax=Papilio polytes TaxID=76194 RepID=UPI000676302D|nr:PREDICTED: lipopolysaccharide-induced tumor necrosis factor-alpha factor homolog [Papilio polytes]